jgi:hypothetical protein
MIIDKPVASLIKTLNKIEGVFTNSSCGGHSVITCVSQVSKGKFMIDCYIENKKFLIFIREFARDNPGFRVTRWSEGEGSEWRYDIQGTHEHLRRLEQKLIHF